MKTQKYINQQSDLINQSLLAIDSLQRQLDELKQQVRVSQQLHQAQETAQTELSKWLNQGKKLLKDCAGVFPSEFLNDIVDEVQEIADSVKENYENFSQSDRFLNSETQQEQDEVIKPQIEQFNILVEPLNNEELPDKNDNEIILNHQQLKVILTELNPSTVTKIQEMLGISKRVKTVSSIALEIERLNKITYRYLTQLIELSNAQTLLLNGNGKH